MDVLVIGAGPAGMNAALWACRLGLSVGLWEAGPAAGGQLLCESSTGDWALGHGGARPAELARRFHADLDGLPGLALRCATQVERLALDTAPGLRVTAAGGSDELVRAVIVTTGLAPRDLADGTCAGVRDRIVVGAGDARLYGALDGGRVGVLGGGDNAFEVALMLAARGCNVDILHRATPRAAPRFQQAVAAANRVCTARIGDDYLVSGAAEGVSVRAGGRTREYDHLVVLIGYRPVTDFLRGSGVPFSDSALDESGFVVTDAAQRTPVARLYAAGDVTGRPYAGLPMALGQAAVAAKSCALDLALLP